jgi:hypothetical protein
VSLSVLGAEARRRCAVHHTPLALHFPMSEARRASRVTFLHARPGGRRRFTASQLVQHDTRAPVLPSSAEHVLDELNSYAGSAQLWLYPHADEVGRFRIVTDEGCHHGSEYADAILDEGDLGFVLCCAVAPMRFGKLACARPHRRLGLLSS